MPVKSDLWHGLHFSASCARSRSRRPLPSAATSLSRVQWTRGGSAPEAVWVEFELSTDGGANFTSLGFGERTAGGLGADGIQSTDAGATPRPGPDAGGPIRRLFELRGRDRRFVPREPSPCHHLRGQDDQDDAFADHDPRHRHRSERESRIQPHLGDPAGHGGPRQELKKHLSPTTRSPQHGRFCSARRALLQWLGPQLFPPLGEEIGELFRHLALELFEIVVLFRVGLEIVELVGTVL